MTKEELRKKLGILELNTENVRDIFSKCMQQHSDPEDEAFANTIFQKEDGFEHENTVIFNKKRLDECEDAVTYMFGQLHSVHTFEVALPLPHVPFTYTGQPWTQEKAVVFEFMHLIQAEKLILPFSNLFNPIQARVNANVEPTVSPNEDFFEEWFKIYRKKTENYPEYDEVESNSVISQ